MNSSRAISNHLGLLALPHDTIVLIARYLDFISLYRFSFICTISAHIIDPAWEDQIKLHFLNKKTDSSRNKKSEHQNLSFFSSTEKRKYAFLSKKNKELFALVRANDLSLIIKRKIRFSLDDFKIEDAEGYNLLSILQSNHNIELNAHLFDQLVQSTGWTNHKLEILTLGIRLNLSDGSFKDLFSEDARAHFQNSTSPLSLAVQHHSLATAAMLLELGIVAQGTEDMPIVHQAAKNGSLKMLELLIEHKMAIEHFGGLSPLHRAAERGNVEIVQCLHEYGLDINTRGLHGSTPLYLAAKNGNLKVVNYLLCKGANMELTTEHGYTALYIAAKYGQYACTERLLQQNPNINAHCSRGSTPLYVASQHGHENVCKLLLDHGADIGREFLGRPPLYVASEKANGVLNVLLSHKIRPQMNHMSPNGKTALLIATENEILDNVKLLCENGADVNIPERDSGKTPLHIAAEKGNDFIIKVLLSHGANLLTKAPMKGRLDIGQTPQALVRDEDTDLKTFMLALEKVAYDMPLLNENQPTQYFDPCYSIKLLAQSNNIPKSFKTLLFNTTNHFGYIVILYSMLERNIVNDVFTQEIIHSLGHQFIADAKSALYEAMIDYLGPSSDLLPILENQVIFPINRYSKQEVTVVDPEYQFALYCLAYFEGSMKNLKFFSLSNNQEEDMKKLFSLMEKISEILTDRKSSPLVKNLILSINRILSNGIDSNDKIEAIKQTILDCYFEIETSKNNSLALFTSDCLAKELEKIIVDVFGYPVSYLTQEKANLAAAHTASNRSSLSR